MFGADDLLAGLRLVFVDHVAGVVYDLEDSHRWDAPSAVGKDGKGAGHFQQADFAAAQRERQAVILACKCGNAQPFGHADHAFFFGRVWVVVNAYELQRLDGRDVERIGKRRADGHRAVKLAVVIDRLVRFARIVWVAGGRKLAWHVPDQRGGRPALFEGGHIVDGFDG